MLTYEMIAKLQPRTVVGHANPELSDWEGIITPDRRDNWVASAPCTDIRVKWHAGRDGRGDLMRGIGWVEASALTIKGKCPDCARPAHYNFPSDWHDVEGWYHDARIDSDTCWAGKARHEASLADRG